MDPKGPNARNLYGNQPPQTWTLDRNPRELRDSSLSGCPTQEQGHSFLIEGWDEKQNARDTNHATSSKTQ